MTYESLDSVLQPWVVAHQLNLVTEFKDEPTRSVNVTSRDGRQKVQIWIDRPRPGAPLSLHVWDYRKRREEIRGSIMEFPELLERAYALAASWLAAADSTR